MDMKILGTTVVCACTVAAPSMMGSDLEEVREMIRMLQKKEGTYKPLLPAQVLTLSDFVKNRLPAVAKRCGIDLDEYFDFYSNQSFFQEVGSANTKDGETSRG